MAEETVRPPRRWRAAALSALLLLGGCGRAPEPVAFHAQGLPETLSAWHLFDLRDGELAPNAGVLPYELNTPLFTDYAHKLRTVWMPAGAAAGYRADEAFDFPVGTILSKTFYYPRLPGEPADSARVSRSDDRTSSRVSTRRTCSSARRPPGRVPVRSSLRDTRALSAGSPGRRG